MAEKVIGEIDENSKLEGQLLPLIQKASDSLIDAFNIALREQHQEYLDHLVGEVSAGKKTIRAEIDFDMHSTATVRFYEVDNDNNSHMIFDLYGKSGMQS